MVMQRRAPSLRLVLFVIVGVLWCGVCLWFTILINSGPWGPFYVK